MSRWAVPLGLIIGLCASVVEAKEMRCDYSKVVMCNDTGDCADMPNSFYAVIDSTKGSYWRCDLEGSEPDGCYTFKGSFTKAGIVTIIDVEADKEDELIRSRIGADGQTFLETTIKPAYSFQYFGSCKAR